MWRSLLGTKGIIRLVHITKTGHPGLYERHWIKERWLILLFYVIPAIRLHKAHSGRFLWNVRITYNQSSQSRDCPLLEVSLWIPATDGRVSKAPFNIKVLLAHILINFK